MQISKIAIDGAAEIWYHTERNLGSGVRSGGGRVEVIAPYWRGRVALQRDRGRDKSRLSPSADGLRAVRQRKLDSVIGKDMQTMSALTRREFIALSSAAACWPAFGGIPPFSGKKFLPDYWCTWMTQNELAAERNTEKSSLAGDQGAFAARNAINEQLLFGKDGWATRMCESIRQGMFLMLDDGWDVPYDTHPSRNLERFGFLEPWPERFPGCGGTPLERLTTINARLRDAGWQGAGLWIAAQRHGDRNGALKEGVEDFYRQRAELSARAGIRYWKVDWGARNNNGFRAMVSRVVREICPALTVEHPPFAMGPINAQRLDMSDGNGVFKGSGRAEVDVDDPALVERFRFSDVIRTYDILSPFDHVTTLERAVAYSRLIDKHGLSTVLNVEDAPVIGAVLGHALGIMRRMDNGQDAAALAECRAALNWHRIAPPFGGTKGFGTVASDETLAEDHRFAENETWCRLVWTRTVTQRAPSVVARGLALPKVRPLGEGLPFVVAGRHPGGATAVGTLPRLREGRGFTTPSVEIALAEPISVGAPLAVFGEPRTVLVPYRGKAGRVGVSVQDLADGKTVRTEANAADGVLRLDVAALKAAVAEGGKPVSAIALTHSA